MFLSSGYEAEIDRAQKDEWSQLLKDFDDANLYQTWSYGEVHWGKEQLSHFLLKEDGRVAALAQARIVTSPLVKKGIAYIFRGPLWRPKGKERQLKTLVQAITALRQEYCCHRGLFLRMMPNEVDDGQNHIPAILQGAGFTRGKSLMGQRTLWIDLSLPLEEIRKNMRRNWRKLLGQAENSNLEVIAAANKENYGVALHIFDEMHRRKKFTKFVNMEELAAVHEDLPPFLKTKLVLCRFEGEPVAAMVWSTLGKVGLPLLAATTTKALQLNASYLLWWKMIEDMKNCGCTYCDMVGIDPEKNPGGFVFKSGLAGKKGKDVSFIGQFDSCEDPMSFALVKSMDAFRSMWRKTRVFLTEGKKSLSAFSHYSEKGGSSRESTVS